MYTQRHSRANTYQYSHAATIWNLAAIIEILQRIQICHPNSSTVLTFPIDLLILLFMHVLCAYKCVLSINKSQMLQISCCLLPNNLLKYNCNWKMSHGTNCYLIFGSCLSFTVLPMLVHDRFHPGSSLNFTCKFPDSCRSWCLSLEMGGHVLTEPRPPFWPHSSPWEAWHMLSLVIIWPELSWED